MEMEAMLSRESKFAIRRLAWVIKSGRNNELRVDDKWLVSVNVA